MSSFHLSIVTPNGGIFDGEAERLTVRTTGGEVTLLARHMDYVAAVGMGCATVVIDGAERTAACIGGMLSMTKGDARLIATTFEWREDIDIGRAKEALRRAEDHLASDELSPEEKAVYTASRKRALVRLSVAQ